LLRFRAEAGERAVGTAKSVLLLWMWGGPSHLDTWDPKPKAPDEIRGPFKVIDTNVPGMQISEIFPKMAKHADKYSLIRSVYHTATAVHDTGHQMMQTGRLFTGGVEHPHEGCVLGYLKGGRGEMPAHVLLPKPIGRTGGNLPHGQSAGYLGKQYDPFVLNADPNDKNFTVPDLLPPDYISSVRAGRRQRMRDAVEGEMAAFEKQAQAKQMDNNFNLAYRLMSSPQAREAFALDKEPESVRDRYGRTRFGQSCLLARRL
ncbi:MAG TPA: DUF1501 domain-containing protein, partial [Planctomycetales bacterium]|nr:DUF1501 domain-containing protein [Planctomycetales bacterium]